MTEKQLQQHVLDLARLLGWRAYHTFDSRHSAAGFPDLVLIKPPRLLFVELKSDKGKLSSAQVEWINDLLFVHFALGQQLRGEPKDVPVRVAVWTPQHWWSGEIDNVLKGEA